MRFPAAYLLVIAAALSLLASARGQDLPAGASPEQAIDHYIEAKLRTIGISAAPQTDDANLLRRTMLDLVGRIPTVSEAKAYLAATESDKRITMVDRLMASPAFVRQQAAEFDALLMDGTQQSLRDYLARAFGEQRSWDRMFRDMLTGEPDDKEQKGAIRFVASRAKDPDKLTNETSVLFFGVNVSCAKCHDHPLVADWTQDHYYGMFSFFSRIYDVGEFLGEREYGRVSYQTVSGESRDAKLMFLTGQSIDEPASQEPDENAKKEEKKRIEEWKKSKQPPPAPGYSRREVLVETALKDDQQLFFARAIVNHLWNRCFGRGLVHPPDQMHSANTPSHPELLDWLARDLKQHGYDLRHLLRGIVLSQAYARTSRWESADKRPSEDLFAVAQLRPLKPWQYGTSLLLAAGNPDTFPAEMPAEELDKRVQGLEGAGRGLGDQFELPRGDFQVGVDEALLFSNSERIAKDLLRDGNDRLVGKLATITDHRAVAETAIWSVFGRPPAEEEVATLADYLAQRADRLPEARRQLVWSLLTSGEFRFNY